MPNISTSDSSASTSPLLTPESTGASGSQLAIVIDSPTSNASSGTAATRKARRQTAFYPTMNSSNKPQKPFSRSAAKRESVMALGSIEHLQHYFTKTGIASKKASLDKLHHALVPAIGGKEHVPTSPLLDPTQLQMPPPLVMPPTPAPAFQPHIKTYDVDPESLLPGVIEDLIAVSLAWKLDSPTVRGRQDQPSLHVPTTDRSFAGPFDVLGVLKITTRAIRSTRNYLFSLPDESVVTSRTQYRSNIFEPTRQSSQPLATSSSAIIASSSTSNTSTSTADAPSSQSDTITLIRRSALEVLTVLRQLEENCRLPLSDDAYDAQSDGGLSRGMAGARSDSTSPLNITLDLPSDELDTDPEPTSVIGDPDASFSFSLVQVQGRYESVPVWEDDDDEGFSDLDAETTKRDGWDVRLVLSSGWLYKQDVNLEELVKERSVVRHYLDVVDELLFNGKKTDGERGWIRVRRERDGKRATSRSKRRVSMGDAIERSEGLLDPTGGGGSTGRRRVSTGMVQMLGGLSLSEEPENMHDIEEDVEDVDEEEETPDDELPEWAKRAAFVDDKIGRAHALLLFFLPSQFQAVLGNSRPTSRTSFLTTLSSGQLLCIAYNACVRKSRKPWGFVSKDGIHDILALEREASRSSNGDEEGRKKVWTFRRTDNLRLWVGALKLRYTLPIYIPSHFSSNPSSTLVSSPSAKMQSFNDPIKQKANHRGESPIVFDARGVAKKEEGWEDMLESVLMRWMDKVVEERRVA